MDEIRTRDSLESERKEVGFVRIRYKVEIPLPPTGHVDLSKLQISEKLNRPCQFRPRVRILTMDNVRQCEAHSRKPCERKERRGGGGTKTKRRTIHEDARVDHTSDTKRFAAGGNHRSYDSLPSIKSLRIDEDAIAPCQNPSTM